MVKMKNEQLIYGSTAIAHWCPDFPRTPKDLDIISKSGKSVKGVEYHWIPEFQYFLDNNKDDKYLDLEFIYLNKSAHFGWDIHWEKTRNDILFLKSKGLKCDREIYKKLVKGWIKVHGKRWASLKGKDSKTFFEDAVPRKYVHDDIHEAIAVYEKPLYESLIVDGVTCGEDAFNRMTYEDQLLLVKEEVWVTALERWLIPQDFKYSKKLAYNKAFKKLCTTMSSGYFKFFIIDNIDKLWKDDNFDWVDKFKSAEKQNKIRTT